MTSVSYETYQKVLTQENEIKQFLNVVFQQVETDRFYQIFLHAMQTNRDGMGVYRDIRDRAGEAQGGLLWRIRRGLHSLKEEKDTLADNIAKISDPLHTREGYLEINLPFRMGASVRRLMGVEGKAALVTDMERATDCIQRGCVRRSYDVFVPYGIDNPLKKEDFPFPISVIGMFAGLHHCRPENLQKFVQSIYDLLEPGGIFLLRDHDAKTEDKKVLADVAHRFFNALTGVADKNEEAEIRNFQALSYFINLAQSAGFKLTSSPLIREGDTTDNALIKFYKPAADPRKAQVDYVREWLINVCKERPEAKSYTRKKVQTDLTKVEWLNVEQEKAQAKCYKDSSFWNYPHYRDAKESVSVFLQSLSQARTQESTRNVLLSDYTLMNSTITAASGIQNVVKGILYTPVSWMSKLAILPGQNNPAWKKPAEYYGEWMQQYSQSLEVIPSYEHPYYQKLLGYFSVLKDSYQAARQEQSLLSLALDPQTVKNISTGVAMTADLLWRQLFASAVKSFYGGQENADAREIGLIVDTNGKKDLFKGCEEKIKAIVGEEGNPCQGIVVPRYKELTEVLSQISQNGGEVVEIAGQDEIEVEFIVGPDEKAPQIKGVVELYRRHCYADETKKIAACMVSVNQLHQVLTAHRERIHRIYDF